MGAFLVMPDLLEEHEVILKLEHVPQVALQANHALGRPSGFRPHPPNLAEHGKGCGNWPTLPSNAANRPNSTTKLIAASNLATADRTTGTTVIGVVGRDRHVQLIAHPGQVATPPGRRGERRLRRSQAVTTMAMKKRLGDTTGDQNGNEPWLGDTTGDQNGDEPRLGDTIGDQNGDEPRLGDTSGDKHTHTHNHTLTNLVTNPVTNLVVNSDKGRFGDLHVEGTTKGVGKGRRG